MWERRAELEGFAAVMEGVRNAAPRLAGRAIAGPHDYAQIPELVERSKRRVANFYSDMDASLADVAFIAARIFLRPTSPLGGGRFRDARTRHACSCRDRALRYWYDTVAARPSATASQFYERKPTVNKASCSMRSTRCRTNVAKRSGTVAGLAFGARSQCPRSTPQQTFGDYHLTWANVSSSDGQVAWNGNLRR